VSSRTPASSENIAERTWRCSRASPETTMSASHSRAHAASEARRARRRPIRASRAAAARARACGVPRSSSTETATPTYFVTTYVRPARTGTRLRWATLRRSDLASADGAPPGPRRTLATVARTPRPRERRSTHWRAPDRPRRTPETCSAARPSIASTTDTVPLKRGVKVRRTIAAWRRARSVMTS
jgi:hypothetical protein